MPKIRSIAAVGEKWKRRTEIAGPEYEEGVKNPKKDWATETKRAEASFEAGITQAIRDKRFGKGVGKAGTGKWQEGAVTKGVTRFGPGVAVAEAAYEKGFAPFRDVIEATVLPTRYAKGDPRNFQRVIAMGTALHKKKIGK